VPSSGELAALGTATAWTGSSLAMEGAWWRAVAGVALIVTA
jgi:hypothetical protein